MCHKYRPVLLLLDPNNSTRIEELFQTHFVSNFYLQIEHQQKDIFGRTRVRGGGGGIDGSYYVTLVYTKPKKTGNIMADIQ